MRPLFSQERVASSAGSFLDGLLGEERRKTGWMRAEAAGDPGPWRQQAILGRGRWDGDALRDIVRDYVVETLGDPQAVLVIDETGFLKQGKASCGVGRQYTGSAGKITNCQIGVFASYVSRRGHAFIDRALYLPKAWTDDPDRMAAAHVPSQTSFATKPAIARTMIERALAAILVKKGAQTDALDLVLVEHQAALAGELGGPGEDTTVADPTTPDDSADAVVAAGAGEDGRAPGTTVASRRLKLSGAGGAGKNQGRAAAAPS